MDFEPINITINDHKLFADVVFVIDSPFFIKRAREIRKKYKIHQPTTEKDYFSWVVKRIKSPKLFFEEVDNVRFEMNLTVNYQVVCLKAILGCGIKNGDYESTYLINFQDIPKNLLGYPPKGELYGIVLTPQSNLEAVQRVFTEYSNIVRGMRKDRDAKDIFNEYVRSKETKKTDIRIVRHWYWIRYGDIILGKSKKPKSYRAVLESWRDECPKLKEHLDNPKEYDRCQHCSLNDQNIIEHLVPEYSRNLIKS